MPAKVDELVLTLMGTPEYLAWLAKIAEDSARTKTAVARLALAEYAKNHGLEAPPKN